MKRIFVAVILSFVLSIAQADVVLINNKILNQTKLFRYEVQSIFTMRKTYWDNGIPVTPIFISFDDPTHLMFVSQILRLSPYHFNNLISAKIQQGDAKHYIVVNSVEEAIATVTKVTGSIAYITSLEGTLPNSSLQVIQVVD